MAIVKIPTPLRRLTGEKDEVLTSSNSVSEMIDDLESQFPGIKDRLCDENGGIRKFINIYINEEDIRFLDGPKTQINEKDTVSIIPAIAGGTTVN
ncbi:MAG: MoaD/ThiS family protein [Thermodesulfobacteriota bacterium]|jgi:molybdopterin synthase sulfur carrier subunit|nr:molybdopterin synthase sulfur carrier subunit [bacterium]MBT3850009.1 molybdopterin synthase sulfur carrier subunit [bacterium]NSW99237.1 MoaD/ThiS family protein [bacterium]|tara:strand:- start:815 stop:1099 length:285 start_codon:yes stop_codon:yes gene_type:complete